MLYPGRKMRRTCVGGLRTRREGRKGSGKSGPALSPGRGMEEGLALWAGTSPKASVDLHRHVRACTCEREREIESTHTLSGKANRVVHGQVAGALPRSLGTQHVEVWV